ncbi:16609_t:CDS:2 [Funneliformis geosporum]|uniref:protein S-acyltransferase n=1 Tax=Funneliformis geosporum TaxID=1117311 RepID=A0A9W4WMC6_9GLOM|nr:16609_t:CDS:2 [Funneliformis geosporum]
MAPSKIQGDDSERSNGADGVSSTPGGLNISAAKATAAVSVNKTESHITSFSAAGDHFSGMTIHQAAQQGNLHIIKSLIENGYAKATDRDSQNVTALHWAAINNQVVVAKYLIENGAEIDAFGGDLVATPLHWAARNGHLSIVTLLINHGADPNLRDSQGFNGLHLATHSSNTMLVLYLIYQDMDIDTPDTLQHTPLMWAAYQGDPLTLDLFIRLGASISKVDTAHFTPLHWAVTKGNQICVRKLIEAGADISAKEEKGKSPADLAREMNVEKVWNRALSESGWTKSGNRKIYLFGQVLIRAHVPDAMMRTPYFSSLFQASAFWVAVLTDPGFVPKLTAREEQKELVINLANKGMLDARHLCITCLVNFLGAAPVYDPIPSEPCFLNDTICGFFQYDTWTMSLSIWLALQLTWTIGLICMQSYQIATAKTTNEMANFHRYSYFGNRSGGNVREQIMATLAAGPGASRAAQVGDHGGDDLTATEDGTDEGFGDHAHQRHGHNRNHHDNLGLLRLFGGNSQRNSHNAYNSSNGNPFDFGCWNNCVDFWSQGQGGMLQNVDWYGLFDVPLVERRTSMTSRGTGGYMAVRGEEEIV